MDENHKRNIHDFLSNECTLKCHRYPHGMDKDIDFDVFTADSFIVHVKKIAEEIKLEIDDRANVLIGQSERYYEEKNGFNKHTEIVMEPFYPFDIIYNQFYTITVREKLSNYIKCYEFSSEYLLDELSQDILKISDYELSIICEDIKSEFMKRMDIKTQEILYHREHVEEHGEAFRISKGYERDWNVLYKLAQRRRLPSTHTLYDSKARMEGEEYKLNEKLIRSLIKKGKITEHDVVIKEACKFDTKS